MLCFCSSSRATRSEARAGRDQVKSCGLLWQGQLTHVFKVLTCTRLSRDKNTLAGQHNHIGRAHLCTCGQESADLCWKMCYFSKGVISSNKKIRVHPRRHSATPAPTNSWVLPEIESVTTWRLWLFVPYKKRRGKAFAVVKYSWCFFGTQTTCPQWHASFSLRVSRAIFKIAPIEIFSWNSPWIQDGALAVFREQSYHWHS